VQSAWTTRGFLPSTRFFIARSILKNISGYELGRDGRESGLVNCVLASRQLATGEDPTAPANVLRACELVRAWIAAVESDEGSAAYGRREARP
jgi:hypothetical protein